ncbi:MAG: putative L-ribulose-5-phosphate 4-epimerase [Acidobacteria bacterium]|nr:putative L-ribulose-5-phosphate 4-epimerase [Acidobacteriota bacterium]
MPRWVEAERRAQLVAVGALLARRGLIRAAEGNLSCRLDDGRVLLTPRGGDKGRLDGAALIVCAVADQPPSAASSEALAHLETYRRRPEIGALVHAHPEALLALDALGELPRPGDLKEGELLVGRIARVAALPPGSRELAVACAEALADATVVVMARHGALAAGADPAQALARLEAAELLARVALARGARR